MNRNMKQWTQEIVASKKRVAIPIMTYPGLEIIGRNVRDAVCHGDVLLEALKAIVKTFHPAAVTTIMDLSLEAEAFGAEVRYVDDEVPTVTGRIVSDSASVARLRVPSINDGRIPQFLKCISAASGIMTDIPVFGGCIGPVSLAGRLFDFTEIMTAMYTEPETVHALLVKCARLLASIAIAYKAAGADGIVMAEPAAGMLSAGMCAEFSSHYVKRVADAVAGDSFFFVLHNCGNTDELVDSMLSTGANGLHFGNKADMVARLASTPRDRLVMGNIDPVAVRTSTPDDIYRRTAALLDTTRDFPHFVLSTGCDTPPHTPIENVKAFYAALDDYNND